MWLRLLKASPKKLKNTPPNNPVRELLEQLQLNKLYSTIMHFQTMLRIYLDEGNTQILMTGDTTEPLNAGVTYPSYPSGTTMVTQE